MELEPFTDKLINSFLRQGKTIICHELTATIYFVPNFFFFLFKYLIKMILVEIGID